jgi:hypothetical protein
MVRQGSGDYATGANCHSRNLGLGNIPFFVRSEHCHTLASAAILNPRGL